MWRPRTCRGSCSPSIPRSRTSPPHGQSIGSGAPIRTDASGDPVDLASGGVRLEVRRAGDVATVSALAAADYALRTALARGATLEDAAAAALGVDPHFDLTAALHALLDERIFTGFAVSN